MLTPKPPLPPPGKKLVPLLTWEFEDPLALLPWVSRNLLSHITESLVPTEWMVDFHIILLEPSHFALLP